MIKVLADGDIAPALAVVTLTRSYLLACPGRTEYFKYIYTHPGAKQAADLNSHLTTFELMTVSRKHFTPRNAPAQQGITPGELQDHQAIPSGEHLVQGGIIHSKFTAPFHAHGREDQVIIVLFSDRMRFQGVRNPSTNFLVASSHFLSTGGVVSVNINFHACQRGAYLNGISILEYPSQGTRVG